MYYTTRKSNNHYGYMNVIEAKNLDVFVTKDGRKNHVADR